MTIADNFRAVLRDLPPGVELVVVAKNRESDEVLEAVDAGATVIGENYVQEAERARVLVDSRVSWHLIGHLQKNKVKKAVGLFDLIETVDSMAIAREVDRRCAALGKPMPVFIEVNIGGEPQKSGVLPEKAEALLREVSELPFICVMGLMTIEPHAASPECARPYFRKMKQLFEYLKSLDIPHTQLRYLSMGMSDTYRVAIEEGANVVRIGSKIFET